MMKFNDETFLLRTKTAKKLYDIAKTMPIIDYHCHLSPKMIAEDTKFSSITELFLGGDHYKWRLMRSSGVDEKYITGDGNDFEKFEKFAECLSLAIGNPLYHWTHLELKRYFNINQVLSKKTCKDIYERCNEMLKKPEYSVRGLILKYYDVRVICTTDDPLDSLEYHAKIAADGFPVKVLPTFRPDKALNIDKDTFLDYVQSMGASSYSDFCEKLVSRIEHFEKTGCRISDHSLDYVPYALGDPAAVFAKKLSGCQITKEEADIFKTAVLRLCASEYAARGWAMQLHIGAMRNNNTKMYKRLGPDTGFDSMNDICIAENLASLLDSLETENKLPKTILYSLNPKDNYTLGTMIGNFQGAEAKGKLQLGSGWWFNDQRDGIVAQLCALANLWALGCFVGMLTDSRSFVSYTRHEYFRRILCSLIGRWVEDGEYPDDAESLGAIIKNIAYENALNYFAF